MWARTRTRADGPDALLARPALPEDAGDTGAVVASDFARLSFPQLAWAPSLVPALRCLYGDDDDEEAAGVLFFKDPFVQNSLFAEDNLRRTTRRRRLGASEGGSRSPCARPPQSPLWWVRATEHALARSAPRPRASLRPRGDRRIVAAGSSYSDRA